MVYFRDKNAVSDETDKSDTNNNQVEVIKLYLFPVVPAVTFISVKF